MSDGTKNTMENNPTETTEKEPVAVESPEGAETTPEAEAVNPDTKAEDSSSKEEDLTALIEAEKTRNKPDPRKAMERIEKKRHQEEDEIVDEEDRPVTRKELERFLAEQQQRIVLESQEDKIVQISEEVAGSAQEAEFVRAVHANRVFPAGMSLREQMQEAYAIANAKRIAARNAELTRKIISQQNASKNTATTHRDPQKGTEPELAPDLKASLVRSGYTFNGTTRRYEKKLPNGKILVKESGKPPYLAN
jgi:hypothetical protein